MSRQKKRRQAAAKITGAVQSPAAYKLIIQTNSPYCEVTDSVRGDVNVLKKLDCAVTLISGKNMVPAEMVQEMGYTYSLNTKTKTLKLKQ